MNDFDDRELGDALRRRAGATADGYGLEAVRSKVVARAGRIRRRRVAVAGGAAMTGLIAAAALVIGPGTDSVVTTPADQTVGSTPASIDRTLPTTSAPITAVPNPTTLPAVVLPTVPPTATATPPTAPAEPGTTVATPATDPPASPPATSPATTSPATTSPATTSPSDPPSTETYSSPGGSITVRWDGVALSLQQVVPGPGFTHEVEHELADRIRVRFERDDGDFRIEIRVEDGAVVRVE
jgi:hypothetical protein